MPSFELGSNQFWDCFQKSWTRFQLGQRLVPVFGTLFNQDLYRFHKNGPRILSYSTLLHIHANLLCLGEPFHQINLTWYESHSVLKP